MAGKAIEARWSRAIEDAFLENLAQSANVTASAKTAGLANTALVYRQRQRSEAFRARWAAALAEGYARLEAEMLAEALRPASGHIKDVTLRARQMKIRLAMALLAMHRAAVRGSAPAPLQKPKGTARQRVTERLARMHRALGDDDADAAE